MSNALIGILSMVILIGLVLAGGVFFAGPFMTTLQDGRSLGYLSRVTSVASAVAMRNREEATSSQAGSEFSYLTPVYLDEIRPLPNGRNVTLLNASGGQTGRAAFAAGSLGPATVETRRMCSAIASFAAGRDVTFAQLTTWPATSARGCFQPTVAMGGFAANSLVVFARI